MSSDMSRIQGYVSPAVYEKLVEFKTARDLKSISLALAIALEDYFAVRESLSSSGQAESLVNRVELLEGKISGLTQEVSVLNQVVNQTHSYN